MSIFGSMATAVLGLNAQSRALGHISDNIANAQTSGYKRVDTSFDTLVLQSSTRFHAPGGVIAQPEFQNNLQGNLTQVSSATSMAIQGDGFFTVTRPSATSATGTTVKSDKYYTRLGDFELDKDRYLTNSAGFQLNGWVEDINTNVLNTFTEIKPIQILNTLDKPVPTSALDVIANLPATPKAGAGLTDTTIKIYDNLGQQQTLTLKWRQEGQDDWRLLIDTPSSITKPMGPGFSGQTPTATAGRVTQGNASRKQVDTVTIGTSTNYIQVGETYTIAVNGIAFSQTVTTDNVGTLANFGGIAAALADKINAAVPSPGVQASIISDTARAAGKLVLTATSAGTAFSSTSAIQHPNTTTNTSATYASVASASNGPPSVAQVDTLTFNGPGIDVGDMWTVAIPALTGPATSPITTAAKSYTLTATAANYSTLRNIKGVTQALADMINSDTTCGVAATVSGSVMTLTAKTPGTAGAFNNSSTFTVNGSSVTTTTPQGWVVTNGSNVPNTSSTAHVPTNISGTKEKQTVSLSGAVGDIGANFLITVKSPNEATVTSTTTAATTTTSQVTTVTFSPGATSTALSVGTEYRLIVDGSPYAILVTNDNISTLSNLDGVVSYLVNKVNSDPGRSVTAVAGATGSGQIFLTGKNVNTAFSVSKPSITQFNELFQMPANPKTGLNGTTGDELTIGEIASTIANQINAKGIPVQATVSGGAISITSTDDSISFVVDTQTTAGTTPGFARLKFGGTDPVTNDPVPAGTIRSLDMVAPGGTARAPSQTAAGDSANVVFTVDFGSGPQEISLNLGQFQRSTGVTQYAGETVNVSSTQQNGSPRGQFKNVEIGANGDIVVNFDNGRSRTVAKVPLTLFNNPNALQRESGGIYSQTSMSGTPNGPFVAGTNGTGQVIPNSLEGSNVDIADEFTKLIVTQRTYSANSKIVTTADEMLQEILGMKR